MAIIEWISEDQPLQAPGLAAHTGVLEGNNGRRSIGLCRATCVLGCETCLAMERKARGQLQRDVDWIRKLKCVSYIVVKLAPVITCHQWPYEDGPKMRARY